MRFSCQPCIISCGKSSIHIWAWSISTYIFQPPGGSWQIQILGDKSFDAWAERTKRAYTPGCQVKELWRVEIFQITFRVKPTNLISTARMFAHFWDTPIQKRLYKNVSTRMRRSLCWRWVPFQVPPTKKENLSIVGHVEPKAIRIRSLQFNIEK